MDKKEGYLLFLILLCAFIIRIPQLNFPSIGYHNTKENEYISMAKNMAASKDFISREVYFENAFSDKKDFGLYPQVPFVAYQILLGYKLFGDNLWFARLINIILMLLSILAVFCLTNIFIKERIYAIMAVALLSVLPLGVYFSRNLQPESGAFLFMTLGNLLFIRFIEGFKRKYLLVAAFCIFMTAGYKISFLFGFIPLLFVFSYRKYVLGKKIKTLVEDIFLLVLPLLLLIVYYIAVGQWSFSVSWKGRVNPLSVFTAAYWKQYGPIIWHYAKNENFTLPFLLLFMGGVIKSWLNYKKDAGLFARYLRGWSLIIAPYFMFFSDYLNQHNYYQMPFLGFVGLSIVYCIRELSISFGNYFKRPVKQSHVAAVIFGMALLISVPGLKKSINSHFAVIYPGGDEIGKLLKDITAEEERLFIYTFAQGYAPCVYAQRKCGWCNSPDELKINERKFGIKYIVIYPYYYLYNLNDNIKRYISERYHIKLMGLVPGNGRLVPTIMLLEKGGSLNIQKFFNNTKNIKLQKVYHTVAGAVPFYILKAEN